MKEYRPRINGGFDEFDYMTEECYVNQDSISKLIPCTLEGCVVRLCDMIAYLGKDRQDARRANIFTDEPEFTEGEIGVENAQITNNLTVNIIENSYGHEFIQLDEEYYNELKRAKKENYKYIYRNEKMEKMYTDSIAPMFYEIYNKLLCDLKCGNKNSVIFRHHIDFVNSYRKYYTPDMPYEENEPNQIIVDYLASMTDDYFIDLYEYLFPKGSYSVKYVSYFDN